MLLFRYGSWGLEKLSLHLNSVKDLNLTWLVPESTLFFEYYFKCTLFSLFFVYVCTYVFVCMYTCSCGCVWVHVVWRTEVGVEFFLNWFSIIDKLYYLTISCMFIIYPDYSPILLSLFSLPSPSTPFPVIPLAVISLSFIHIVALVRIAFPFKDKS